MSDQFGDLFGDTFGGTFGTSDHLAGFNWNNAVRVWCNHWDQGLQNASSAIATEVTYADRTVPFQVAAAHGVRVMRAWLWDESTIATYNANSAAFLADLDAMLDSAASYGVKMILSTILDRPTIERLNNSTAYGSDLLAQQAMLTSGSTPWNAYAALINAVVPQIAAHPGLFSIEAVNEPGFELGPDAGTTTAATMTAFLGHFHTLIHNAGARVTLGAWPHYDPNTFYSDAQIATIYQHAYSVDAHRYPTNSTTGTASDADSHIAQHEAVIARVRTVLGRPTMPGTMSEIGSLPQVYFERLMSQAVQRGWLTLAWAYGQYDPWTFDDDTQPQILDFIADQNSFYSDVYFDTYGASADPPEASAPLAVTAAISAAATVSGAGVTAALAVTASRTVTATRSSGAAAARPVTATATASANVIAATPAPTPAGVETRLRAYLPNGADQGPLPGPESTSSSYVLNDVGALTFAYAPQAPRSSLLGQPLEVAEEVSTDGGVTWFEPPNGRFLYLTDGLDPIKTDDRYAVECKSYAHRLSEAVVLPNGLLNTEGKRAFLSSNVGTILKTLLNEAQARGALTGLVHSSFGTGTDTAGAAWNKQLTIYYEPGIDYLSILLDLAAQGFCDFRTNGRALQVYNADTALALDRTVSSDPVTLRYGRDLTEAPFRRTWEAMANFAFFAGDAGATYSYTDPAVVPPWGRKEIFISNGSVSDAGTMATLTQAELAQRDAPRVERTHGLNLRATVAGSKHLPFTHYHPGDYIWSAVNGTAPEKQRVRQITLTRDDKGTVAGNVVLNDRFLEADVRQQRRINGITNGASSGTGTGGPIPGTDTKPPAQVVGLAGNSTAYMGPGGFPQAQVSLNWTPVSTNSDGTPASDIQGYEIFRREFGSTVGTEKHFRTTADASLDDSPYQTGSNWWFSVRAYDQTGNRGAKSVEVAVGMANDAVPPQAPSTPTATARLGQVYIGWDGLPATGSWPGDLSHVDVHVSTTNNFTPAAGTRFDTFYGAYRATTVYTAGTYGIPVYVKFVAYDHAGNASPASAQATATPTRLVGSDLGPDSITFEQLAFKDPGNIVPDGSFEDDSYRALVDGRSASDWTFTNTDRSHGTWSATITVTGTAGADRELVLTAPGTDQQTIRGGEKLFVRMAYKATVGATGVLKAFVRWTLADATTTTTDVVGTVKNNAWQEVAQQVTAPVNAATFVVGVSLSAAAGTGQNWVDAVEVRRTIGTSIIEDAAITNALIANLAVNNAKIADLQVGKLTAGTLAADVLLASTIRTATSGNRVEISSTGIRMFRGSTVTGHWNPTYGQLRLYKTTDASHTSTGHGLQFGDDNDQNLIIDDNEIMSRFNGTYGGLNLNREGGQVAIGGKIGGFPTVGDYATIPANDNHVISLRGSVQVNNTSDGDYADEWPPFLVGERGDLHIWMDSNEVGASTADGPSALHLNPPLTDGTDHNEPVFLASGHVFIERSGFGQFKIASTHADCALQFIGGQINARNAPLSGNRSMGASAFNVLSQSDTKKSVGRIRDALATVRAVESKRWQFRNDINPEDRWHYGPMLEDLPEEMRAPIGDDQAGYDLGSALGLLWEAVRELAEKVERSGGGSAR